MTTSVKAKGGAAAAGIDALMALHPKGYDLSLDRIRGLLEKLGNPQDRLPPVVHVAGTNGKGSTIAFLRAILEAEGLAVHVHTSPHLVRWHERYRLAGRLAQDEVLAEAIDRVAKANQGRQITVFEILTAVMFVLFAEHPADVALVEVGLGGRFDATNVMATTAVSVITSISIDHEAWLGDTHAKIAFEKAGILRRGTPAIIAPQVAEALEAIEKQARKMRAPLTVAGEDFHATVEDGRFLFTGEDVVHEGPVPVLPGPHQIDNAGTAIAAARALLAQLGRDLSNEAVEAGLATAVWPGRMQRLPDGALAALVAPNRDVWLDGGHNPGAGAALAHTLAAMHHRAPAPLVLICAMLDTKDPRGWFETLTALNPTILTVPIVSSEAGIAPEALAQVARNAGLRADATTSLDAAMRMAGGTEGARIVLAGSLYLVGEALQTNGTPPT